MSAKHPPILVRAAAKADLSFILDSWLSSFRHAYHVRGVEGPTYFKEHRRVLETLLQRCTVLVACDQESPSTIYGYIVAEMIDHFLTVHWVYVRGAKTGGFQDLGIGTYLLKQFLNASEVKRDAIALVYTHQTKSGRKWAEKMAPRMPDTEHGNGRMPIIYNPYFLYRTLGAAWNS